MRSLLAKLASAALLSAAALAPTADAAPRLTALGVGPNSNLLVSFDAASPGTISTTAVTGLGSFSLVGIDRRPADGQLYGLGVNGSTTAMFRIDPASGVASSVGSDLVNSLVGATAFGVDFNPVSDRLRVVNDLASEVGANTNNFRLNPNSGLLAGVDVDLNSVAPGLSAEAAIAHDRSVAGATATTLYGIVAVGDSLVRQGGVDNAPSANGGTLTAIGPLGIDITTNAGLDIDPATGQAWAVLQSAGVTGLYGINLATGAATLAGKVGNGLAVLGGLSIDPPPVAGPPPPAPVEPKLESLSLHPRSFATVNAGGAILSKARRAPVGTTVRYTLSAAATVSFKVERKRAGRKVGKACKKQTPGNRDRKPCPLFKPVKGSFSHSGATGGNSFRFTGRPGGKALKPGAYRLLAGAGSSALRTGFTVVSAAPKGR